MKIAHPEYNSGVSQKFHYRIYKGRSYPGGIRRGNQGVTTVPAAGPPVVTQGVHRLPLEPTK